MEVKAGIFIISLLFLVGTVAAAGPFTITITSSKTYLTAGYTDNQAVISVNVKNSTTNANVAGAGVTFSVDDASLGTFQNPGPILTDSGGNVNSTFISTTKSGITNISVMVTYLNATSTQTFVNGIKVDHDKAHAATFDYPFEGAVGTNVTFNISFTDRWGNPMDQKINPGKLHTINLHVTGPNPYDCIFVGYGPDILGKQLDVNGNVSVKVRLTSGAGPNVVTMDSFEDIPIETNYITAISTEPFSIKQVFNPDSPPQVPANGVNKFTILYSLFDKFGNPANQQWVWVNTSVAGDEQKFKTDNLGQITITYGPRFSIGIINITATAVNNNTVTISHEVEFTSTAATTIVLTANPETMASRDVNPSITSDIIATVTDIMGNPVENESVTFSLGTAGYPGGPYNVTSSPSLSSYSTIKTDQNGDAMVQFIPGSFNTNTNAVNYSATATGNCTVTASWISSTTGNTTSKNILVTWKNYPYLSVTTSVNPQTIAVNDTVDVTIAFKGDGWALQPSPLDVVLVMDRSGSMDDAMGSHTKLYYAKAAATTFVAQMNQSRDRIGLVSYAGYTSGTGTSIDISPTYTYSSVNTKINNLNANGATETREALKQSIDLLKAYPNSNPKAIQSIILMTDGDYNWKGDPMGRGTARDSSYGYSTNTIEPNNFLWYSGLGCSLGATNCQPTNQNMSVYAKNNNIRLYTIGFSAHSTDFDPQAITDMQVMANATGGFYSYAPDAATLSQIYTKIAGDLKNDAGVNTTMLADFQNVNVTGVSVPGPQVYDYVYNSSASTKIRWQDGVSNVTNQSGQWAANHQLNFNIGTIKVGQTWQATFRLKVKQSGSIDLFGSNSLVSFNNGTSTLTLPHTFLTVVPNLNATGFQPQQIDVISSCPPQAQNSAIIPLTWNVTYIGGATDISEIVSYIDLHGLPVPFYYGGYHVTGNTNITRSTQFDMRTVPPGTYSIQVSTSTADNTATTSQACGNYTYSTKGTTFIKLT